MRIFVVFVLLSAKIISLIFLPRRVLKHNNIVRQITASNIPLLASAPFYLKRLFLQSNFGYRLISAEYIKRYSFVEGCLTKNRLYVSSHLGEHSFLLKFFHAHSLDVAYVRRDTFKFKDRKSWPITTSNIFIRIPLNLLILYLCY